MGSPVCGTDDFCGGGVSRPHVDETTIGKSFLGLLGKADKRTDELFNLMAPLLKTASGQAGDILSGSAGPMTPAIQTATTGAMSNLSNTLTQTKENLDRMGITGTDAAKIMTDTERQGGQQVASIPAQFTTPILQQIFQALAGTPALAVGSQGAALSSAGGVTSAQIQPIKGDTFADYMNAVANNVNAFSGGGGMS